MNSRRYDTYDAIDRVVREPAPARADALAALAGLPALRAELDAIEGAAIDAARRAGASWSDIAGALRLRSRQAAEQRRLRLGPVRDRATADTSAIRARRRRQQVIDKRAGASVVSLRADAASLALLLGELPATPLTHLAQATLRIAADAEPGALVDLVRLALADLESVHAEPLAELIERLRKTSR